jgi:mRNA interferase HigB
MNVISRNAIRQAAARHPAGANWLAGWFATAKRARWANLHEVRSDFPSADQVGRCLVFNAPQGRRLISRVVYADQHQNGTLFVKDYLTHAEYDKERWKGACE